MIYSGNTISKIEREEGMLVYKSKVHENSHSSGIISAVRNHGLREDEYKARRLRVAVSNGQGHVRVRVRLSLSHDFACQA